MLLSRYSASISRDHVALTNHSTGASVARAAVIPFSSDQQIIADYGIAHELIGELVRELEGSWRWLRIATVTVTITSSRNSDMDTETVDRLFKEHGFVRVRIG